MLSDLRECQIEFAKKVRKIQKNLPINLREYPKLPMQKSLTKFILGGAQLGIPNYGITNQGTYDALHVKKLIQVAFEQGISRINIAMDYGEAQKIIGNLLKENKYNNLKIINKFTSKGLPKNSDDIELFSSMY